MEPMSYLGVKGENNKFQPDSPKAFSLALAGFKPGQRVRVTFDMERDTRSERQNKAFYGVVVRYFCEFMGYRFGNEREKEYVKGQVLEAVGHYELVRGLDGKEKKLVKPTKKMEKKAFSELYEACQELGATMGIMIPDPESPQAMGAKA